MRDTEDLEISTPAYEVPTAARKAEQRGVKSVAWTLGRRQMGGGRTRIRVACGFQRTPRQVFIQPTFLLDGGASGDPDNYAVVLSSQSNEVIDFNVWRVDSPNDPTAAVGFHIVAHF